MSMELKRMMSKMVTRSRRNNNKSNLLSIYRHPKNIDKKLA